MSEPFWKTSISKLEPNKIVVRGYNLMDLIGKHNYADIKIANIVDPEVTVRVAVPKYVFQQAKRK